MVHQLAVEVPTFPRLFLKINRTATESGIRYLAHGIGQFMCKSTRSGGMTKCLRPNVPYMLGLSTIFFPFVTQSRIIFQQTTPFITWNIPEYFPSTRHKTTKSEQNLAVTLQKPKKIEKITDIFKTDPTNDTIFAEFRLASRLRVEYHPYSP